MERTPTRPLGVRNENRQNVAAAAPGPVKPATQKKKKPSQLCMTPPAVIQSKYGHHYQRGSCIGEGGFARCFEVKNRFGSLYAAKTMAKTTLTTEKTKAKLLTEIKIHRAMKHPNIVEFVDCFEDNDNVYILLEMCPHQSLMDMVRRRKTLTEPEARFFMVQVLGGVNYMHSRLVLHRDLKLGNIFLDSGMNLKIGDFGLAAHLDFALQRRKTVCGTPNYISPEVIRRPHEHSYPADIWAAGVILYALLFGTPPFQEKQVDVIYQRIKQHDLRFAEDTDVSAEACDLIDGMLAADPAQRLTVSQALDHPWFSSGPFPDSIPTSALRTEPFIYATAEASAANMEAAKRAAGLSASQIASTVASTVNTAVEPVTRSEISTRDKILPPHISPPSTREKYQVVVMPDGKKAVADYDSPVVDRLRGRVTSGSVASGAPVAARTSTVGAPAAAAAAFNASPAPVRSGLGMGRTPSQAYSRPSSTGTRDILGPLSDSLRRTRQTIEEELRRFNAGELGQAAVAAAQAAPNNSARPAVYVTKWADFDETWGLSYELTDGAVGVLFRDRTSMRMDPMFDTFMYYESRSNPGLVTFHRTAPNTKDVRRSKKVEVLRFVHNYMDERLGQATAPARHGGDCCDGAFVHKFRRLSPFIMFILCDGTLQFNFRDHNKVVLSDCGRRITIITDQRQELSWPLPAALAVSTYPHFARLGLAEKLHEILQHLN